ncbi:LPXTG cell wall anchor domain-containing protein [Enterococcus hirae]|nr:LPXTG cell wall anchor domain-containing protein [Enterococcus hirae]
MKKFILSSLFSATLLLGGTSYTAFAEENLPSNPTIPPTEEAIPPSTDDSTKPSDPVLPPEIGNNGTEGGDTDITAPPETGNSGSGEGETSTPTPPETGNSGSGGGETSTPTPPETGNSGSGGGETNTPMPPETGNSGSGGGETNTPTPPETGNSSSGEGETNRPTPPNTENNSGGAGNTEIAPPTISIGVNPDGTINQSGSGMSTTPIQTNDVNELTHIPTASTPVETEKGEKIVSVMDGVAYKKTNDGTLTPIKAEVKQLPSGNIAVKGSDGQLKVLPKTGTKQTVMMTVLGSLLTLGSGFAWWKKRV